jgi:ABC-type transporter Mla maintaining outer membrane lipid asymmetry ATPase subunit MlaF
MNEANESEQLEVRLRVGVVFSGGGRLFPHFSVAENVALPVLYHGRDAEPGGSERVERVLVGLGLESCAQRSPRDLPRRLAQRVALARALALEPDLLILDDPTAGLPPAETSWWLRFIEGEMEARPPRTVVVAASDPRDWRGVAERFAWVENRTWHVTTETADVLDRWMRPSAAD